ncbi:zinc-binding dehydrogenase [Sinorhizobium meliloti]|uniref:zinc-binding dehydrogenase n=1 Tax=Rhizobium meliloti TaxID=382 RepID=UPI001F40D19D|nr:zinc-binding dehydrogenase [Sinorhizobium meliloti]
MGLYALHRITAGDVILVLGASGSVGSILSRWARALGATVIGVAGSPEKLAKVEAGATHALFASDPELSTKIRAIAQAGVDVVYDFVGKATFPVGVAAVRDGGVIAAIGAASGQPPAATEQMASRGIQIRAGGTPQHVHGGTVAVATEQLWDAVRADLFSDLEVVPYRFEQIGGAHADMESQRLAGLPVLIV